MRAARSLRMIIMPVLSTVVVMRRLITHPGCAQYGTTAPMPILLCLGARRVLVKGGVPNVKEAVEMETPTRRDGFTPRTPSSPSGRQGGRVQFLLDPPLTSPLNSPLRAMPRPPRWEFTVASGREKDVPLPFAGPVTQRQTILAPMRECPIGCSGDGGHKLAQ